MSYHLFLDDIRNPLQITWVDLPAADWVIVRSYEAFVDTITKRGLPGFITFDHDLGDEAMLAHGRGEVYSGPERTGYDCAKWLVEHCLDHELPLPEWRIHSINAPGRERIASYLLSAAGHLPS